MGLGKTFVGSEKMKDLHTGVNLVICQKSKVKDWVKHFKQHYNNQYSIFDLTKNKVEFNIMARTILRKLRHKLIIYFIINFMIILFFWYYATAFCAVYSQTQMAWLKDGLTSFGISLGIPFLICLVFATMRTLSLKYSIKCMFKVLKFLNYII